MPTSQIERGHSRLLAIETPTALGHTSTLTIVDAVNAPHRLNAALLRQEVSARLDDHPMLRQSLAEVPLNLDRPWWRDHPGFDLNYHLRHIAVPDPDDPNSLAELVARIHSRPLDRGRPLWELYLISGLADGRAALLFKMHLAALAASTGNSLCAGLIGESPELIGDPADETRELDPRTRPVAARHRNPSLAQRAGRSDANADHGAADVELGPRVPQRHESGARADEPALAAFDRDRRAVRHHAADLVQHQDRTTPSVGQCRTRPATNRQGPVALLGEHGRRAHRSLRWSAALVAAPTRRTATRDAQGVGAAVGHRPRSDRRDCRSGRQPRDQPAPDSGTPGDRPRADRRGGHTSWSDDGSGDPGHRRWHPAARHRGVTVARTQPAGRPADAAVQHHDHVGAGFEGTAVRARRRGHRRSIRSSGSSTGWGCTSAPSRSATGSA